MVVIVAAAVVCAAVVAATAAVAAVVVVIVVADIVSKIIFDVKILEKISKSSVDLSDKASIICL